MRELFSINVKELKEEDGRFLISRNHSEVLHYDHMLMTNKILMITIFALFTALVSLVVYSPYIFTTGKIIFVVIMTCTVIYLLVTFFNSKSKVTKDKNRLVIESSNIFKHHFSYAK